MNATPFKPAGYPAVIPYLVVEDAGGLIVFMREAFAATEIMRDLRPDGTIWHAQVRIGDAVVMLSDANADNPAMPGLLYVYVEDCDAAFARATEAGAEPVMPPTVMDYGDRNAGVRHDSGIMWWIATRTRDGGYGATPASA
ncbi:MAG: VOC family protein [Hyphomicrobiaceae bacterium]